MFRRKPAKDKRTVRRREILYGMILDEERRQYPKVYRDKEGNLREIPRLPLPNWDGSDDAIINELQKILGLRG